MPLGWKGKVSVPKVVPSYGLQDQGLEACKGQTVGKGP